MVVAEAGAESKGSNLQVGRGSRKRAYKLAKLFEPSNLAPSDMLPPAWPHLQRSPKTVPPTGNKNV